MSLSYFSIRITPQDYPEWYDKMLALANEHPYFTLLENRGEPGRAAWIDNGWYAGIGAKQLVNGQSNFFDSLQNTSFRNPLFGYLGYDLKNQLEKLNSGNVNRIKAPEACFFEPIHFLRYQNGLLEISSYENAEKLFLKINQTPQPHFRPLPKIEFQSGMSEYQYLDKVRQVKEYIRQGEVYELNLCVEFFAQVEELNPMDLFHALMSRSNMPFSAWFKGEHIHAICASPERFLQKTGSVIRSQPIKGTRRRGQTPEEDKQLKQELATSEKDQAENVMIVDLVRNDLTRSCKIGSIEVEELFGIYTYNNVHQMISTVKGSLRDEMHYSEAIKYSFPMGSMTGAPKIRAMELIEELEESKRGIYSGSLGIIHPNGDFDLNVVIRTLLLNAKESVISAQAGGAITWDSVPEEEWEEIKTKLSTIAQVFPEAFIHIFN